MTKPIKVSASILSADFTRLGDEIRRAEDAGCDIIHIDVMDGQFVPNISIGFPILEAVRPLTQLPIDVHLMIDHPSWYLETFAEKGANIISVHAECYGIRRTRCREAGAFPKEVDSVDRDLLRRDLKKIRDLGKQACVVLNPGTPLCIQEVLTDLDSVLIMSVNPGFAHQSFMPEVLPKARKLREIFTGDIAIDGGVKEQTAPLAVEAGVNVLATASYFYGASNPREVVQYLKGLG